MGQVWLQRTRGGGTIGRVTPAPELLTNSQETHIASVRGSSSERFTQPCLPIPGASTTDEWRDLQPDRRIRPGRVAASVWAFHRAFGLPHQPQPSLQDVPNSLLRLRERLLDEEATEFAHAAHRRDLVGMADALADVVYVAYGTAITLGIDLDAVLDEVHRSNMSKLDERGRPVLRDDGKVLKSPRYRPPNVAAVMASQAQLPF